MNKPEFDWGVEFQSYLDSLSEKDSAKFLAVIQRIEVSGIQDSIRK